jgi:outer membrane murein-binding lipoprotein Lpp
MLLEAVMVQDRVTSADQPLATKADIERLSREIADLRAAVDRLTREHHAEVTRAGQLQADMDQIRAAWRR